MIPYRISPLGINNRHPLTLTAVENSTVTLSAVGTMSISTLYYRTSSNPAWQLYNAGTQVSLSAGQNIQFWNKASTFSSSDANYLQFSMTGKIAASGNIMSLLDFGSTLHNYCFNFLFYNCAALVSAPQLPAKVLPRQCYWNMLRGTYITSVKISGVTLSGAYSMGYMLTGCPLTSIEVDFTEWTDNAGQFAYWVTGVPSGGTFIKPYALPEEYGVRRIPDGWTVINK